jgi:hypothetical protein
MGVVAKIEVLTGDRSGLRFDVPSGSTIRVGRVAPAEILIPDDPLLSAVHFAVECRGEMCVVKDQGSRFGTFRRGERILNADLLDGDEILAGRSRFSVALLEDGVRTPAPIATSQPIAAPLPVPEPVAAPAVKPRYPAVKDFLAGREEPLYAILDAAREPTVPARLARSGEQHQCLFECARNDELALFAPWIVRLPRWSDFLEELVADGWGNSWGVYLTCDRPLPEVRKHLRRFLEVKLPDGRQVCFRYYDPRVLRTYLPTCTPMEVTSFLGPITRYFAESADVQHVLEFVPAHRDWRKVQVSSVAG